MADDRMYLRCRVCGAAICLARFTYHCMWHKLGKVDMVLGLSDFLESHSQYEHGWEHAPDLDLNPDEQFHLVFEGSREQPFFFVQEGEWKIPGCPCEACDTTKREQLKEE